MWPIAIKLAKTNPQACGYKARQQYLQKIKYYEYVTTYTDLLKLVTISLPRSLLSCIAKNFSYAPIFLKDVSSDHT